ncbi:MAG: TIGR04283 family arsenosugar biosynthesis glycosyltransferase [Cyclobacteriaceae bacterium]
MISEFRLSIIIPTLNEKTNIKNRLDFFQSYGSLDHIEIIVVDGNSTDGTQDVVRNYPFARLINSPVAARPNQMNMGATNAQYEWLYFLHADVQIPSSFFQDIYQASSTHLIGGYRYQFDSNHLLLKVNAFFTRFPMMWCRGGDQTLFIKRSFFEELSGFDEYFEVMEDFDIIKRAKKSTDYCIIPKNVIVSSRKYHHNGYWKVQRVNLKAFRMFRNGVDPKEIRIFYKKALGLKDY